MKNIKGRKSGSGIQMLDKSRKAIAEYQAKDYNKLEYNLERSGKSHDRLRHKMDKRELGNFNLHTIQEDIEEARSSKILPRSIKSVQTAKGKAASDLLQLASFMSTLQPSTSSTRHVESNANMTEIESSTLAQDSSISAILNNSGYINEPNGKDNSIFTSEHKINTNKRKARKINQVKKQNPSLNSISYKNNSTEESKVIPNKLEGGAAPNMYKGSINRQNINRIKAYLFRYRSGFGEPIIKLRASYTNEEFEIAMSEFINEQMQDPNATLNKLQFESNIPGVTKMHIGGNFDQSKPPRISLLNSLSNVGKMRLDTVYTGTNVALEHNNPYLDVNLDADLDGYDKSDVSPSKVIINDAEIKDLYFPSKKPSYTSPSMNNNSEICKLIISGAKRIDVSPGVGTPAKVSDFGNNPAGHEEIRKLLGFYKDNGHLKADILILRDAAGSPKSKIFAFNRTTGEFSANDIQTNDIQSITKNLDCYWEAKLPKSTFKTISTQGTSTTTLNPSTHPSTGISTQGTSTTTLNPSTNPSTGISTQGTSTTTLNPSTNPSTGISTQGTSTTTLNPSTHPSTGISTQGTSTTTLNPSTHPSTGISTQGTSTTTLNPSTHPSTGISTQGTSTTTLNPSTHPSTGISTQGTSTTTLNPSTNPSTGISTQGTSTTTLNPSTNSSTSNTFSKSSDSGVSQNTLSIIGSVLGSLGSVAGLMSLVYYMYRRKNISSGIDRQQQDLDLPVERAENELSAQDDSIVFASNGVSVDIEGYDAENESIINASASNFVTPTPYKQNMNPKKNTEYIGLSDFVMNTVKREEEKKRRLGREKSKVFSTSRC